MPPLIDTKNDVAAAAAQTSSATPAVRHPMYELKLKLDSISPGWYRYIDWNSPAARRQAEIDAKRLFSKKEPPKIAKIAGVTKTKPAAEPVQQPPIVGPTKEQVSTEKIPETTASSASEPI